DFLMPENGAMRRAGARASGSAAKPGRFRWRRQAVIWFPSELVLASVSASACSWRGHPVGSAFSSVDDQSKGHRASRSHTRDVIFEAQIAGVQHFKLAGVER